MSEIGEFGNKIKYGIFKSLTNLEIPFITEHPLKDYKKDVIKKNIEHILSNIPEIKEKYTPAGKELEVISDFIDVLKTSNDYAKSEFEVAIKKEYNISKIDLNTDAGRTYKYLDILGEGLSKVDKAFRWGSFTADSLEYYFNDYVRNMKYLQVIKDAAGEDDKDLLRAIEELSIEYSKGFAGFLYRNKTKIGQLTIKAIEKAMEDKLDGLELYGVATLILEKGMDISGNTKYAENVEQATGIMLINFRLITSFSRSLNRNVDFLTGKILPDVTEHSWNDLVSLFTVTKAGMIEAYKCMYEIAKDPVEKVYLKNQIDVIKSIQIRPTLPSQNQQAFFTK